MMAPELMKNQKYNEKVDVWALGFVLLDMIDPATANSIRALSLQRLCQEKIDQVISKSEILSPSIKKMMKRQLSVEIDKRPSVDQIFASPWMLEKSLEFGIKPGDYRYNPNRKKRKKKKKSRNLDVEKKPENRGSRSRRGSQRRSRGSSKTADRLETSGMMLLSRSRLEPFFDPNPPKTSLKGKNELPPVQESILKDLPDAKNAKPRDSSQKVRGSARGTKNSQSKPKGSYIESMASRDFLEGRRRLLEGIIPKRDIRSLSMIKPYQNNNPFNRGKTRADLSFRTQKERELYQRKVIMNGFSSDDEDTPSKMNFKTNLRIKDRETHKIVSQLSKFYQNCRNRLLLNTLQLCLLSLRACVLFFPKNLDVQK